MIRRITTPVINKPLTVGGYQYINQIPAHLGRIGIENGSLFLDIAPGVDKTRIEYVRNEIQKTVTVRMTEKAIPAPIINMRR